MERAVLYRRALAPPMLVAGAGALTGAAIGIVASIQSPIGFLVCWGVVAILSALFAMAWMRRQALRAREVFWTLPARRVAWAMLPALAAGAALGVISGLHRGAWVSLLPGLWPILYGTALHAGGFYTPRGIRWLGWIFLGAGIAATAIQWTGDNPASTPGQILRGHYLMGATFGFIHLAYAVYLAATERRSTG